MVAYAVASDGQLHVVGLQSGKDLQKPAPFLPANSQWSNPVAVGTMMYAATTGNCAGAPHGVYAIDLDAADKPVISYPTNGGSVVGSVAFSSDGTTLIGAIGPGSVTADGKANAIVALDPKTLKLKDWFTQPAAEFVTGPTVFRHGAKDVIAAATKDGRVILLDVASLGGANHATPLLMSQSLVASGGSIAAEALATWARAAAATPTARGFEDRWLLVPLSRRIVALRVAEERGVFTLKPEWTANDLTTPATPIIVNGVVFALSTGRPFDSLALAQGRPGSAGGRGSPAVLYAYDGVSGKALWNSGRSMATFASPGSYWSALSQVYVGTDDGTVYAFGFLDERR
jgi:outer membrane protein assembly factor BamB